MTKSKVSLAIAAIFLAQISCYAPRQEYREETPIPIELQIPSTVKHGQEFSITLKTEQNVSCFIVIGYYDNSNNWTGKELPIVIANEDGVCKWEWIIPDVAKDGVGEVRGFVEKGEESTSFIPKTFCIETCP